MELSIKFDTIKSGWPIVYIEGSEVIICKTNVFLSLKINFVLENSEDPDEMPHYASSAPSLFVKVPIKGFLVPPL